MYVQPWQEIFPGLSAEAQNYRGALEFDLMAVNDLVSPFLGAGFYYKTFMWPKAFWEKLYEPLIRSAAGLGALSGKDDRELHDKSWLHCDLLVIGAGPSGLMAAFTAACAGRRVVLADEDFLPGGRLTSEAEEIDGQEGNVWAMAVWSELAAMPNVTLMKRTTVFGAYDGGTYGALERVSEHVADAKGAPRTTLWRIVAKHAILAAGATERPLAFPNNDRPGIMTASAVRSYVTRYGVAPGQRVILFTNNLNGLETADRLREAGVKIGAIVTPMEDPVLKYNCRVYQGGAIIDTRGRLGLQGVLVRDKTGATEWIDADCLAVSGGWNPNVHLTCHMNGRPRWEDKICAFVPSDGAIPGMRVVGAAQGQFSTAAALHGGAQAAKEALGLRKPVEVPEARDQTYEIAPFWHVDAPGRAWLDFQNDVTVKDIKQAHQENFRSVEHMKRYTTLGMATDQGKTANVGALSIMSELTGASISETGTTTFRPPYTPVPIASFGAGGTGKGFAPERFTTTHAFTNARGAVNLEAGLWYRPAYYPQVGDVHWRQSCDREVAFVREAVGICDVSTLGKIDVQGPDAAAFLDFVYVNMISTLRPGRVRYGLMLREDGFVMDDGTVARFGPDHFLITTTTAAAGQVMAHLEFVRQCLRPEMDVSIISVTDCWAQIAVAGPKSRTLLNEILDDPISDETCSYMGHLDVTIHGISGRLFRISFSGEHAYEIAVPASYGRALFEILAGKAEAMGGGLYGMEALNVLRIEKGFITHAEIHGRTTARDCGLGRMVSGKKDCIGKAMSQRPHLLSDARQQLVGIKPAGAVKRLFAGAHIIGPGAEPTRQNDQGYVTSVCYSPTVGSMIGLAFIENGHARMGEQVRAVELLREFDTLVEICPVTFVDPEGERLRG